MLLVIDNEHTRKKFNLVAVNMQGNRAGQDSGIEKDTAPEGKLERDAPRGIKAKDLARRCSSGLSVARGNTPGREANLDVCDPKAVLVDYQAIGHPESFKSHLPWAFAGPPTLDGGVGDHVENDGAQKRQTEDAPCFRVVGVRSLLLFAFRHRPAIYRIRGVGQTGFAAAIEEKSLADGVNWLFCRLYFCPKMR